MQSPGCCTVVGLLSWCPKRMKAGELVKEALCQILKRNGSVEEVEEDLLVAKEEKLAIKSPDGITNNLVRKRSGPEDSIDSAKDDDVSGKRGRVLPSISEESSKELDRNSLASQRDISSDRPNKKDDDNGPVQQLVATFGALVAQGEKAVGSLEILISSISADLLTEVVMANMRYLPTGHL